MSLRAPLSVRILPGLSAGSPGRPRARGQTARDVVVTAASVVLQDPALDITDEAMVRLDAKLPEISLDKP